MKFKQGALVGNLSGSLGPVTASHNRYGAYFRPRTTPVNADTSFQQDVKGDFGIVSASWKAMTANNRAGWKSWAANNPIVDNLGQSQILGGNAAYCQINQRLRQAGAAQISVPPIGGGPTPLTTLTLNADIGAGTTDLVFAATPLAASTLLVIRACYVNSPAISFVKNKMKLIGYSAAAQASPFDYLTLIEARLGAMSVGNYVWVAVSVLSTATGLVTPPLYRSSIISTT